MSKHSRRFAHEQGSVLAVGNFDLDSRGVIAGCTHTETARGAIELLRVLRFDLVVTSDQLPDMSAWRFVQRMRAGWPWQKWTLVSESLTDRDEIAARTLGVTSIMEGRPDWDTLCELASAIHLSAETSERSFARANQIPLRAKAI